MLVSGGWAPSTHTNQQVARRRQEASIYSMYCHAYLDEKRKDMTYTAVVDGGRGTLFAWLLVLSALNGGRLVSVCGV